MIAICATSLEYQMHVSTFREFEKFSWKWLYVIYMNICLLMHVSFQHVLKYQQMVALNSNVIDGTKLQPTDEGSNMQPCVARRTIIE